MKIKIDVDAGERRHILPKEIETKKMDAWLLVATVCFLMGWAVLLWEIVR